MKRPTVVEVRPLSWTSHLLGDGARRWSSARHRFLGRTRAYVSRCSVGGASAEDLERSAYRRFGSHDGWLTRRYGTPPSRGQRVPRATVRIMSAMQGSELRIHRGDRPGPSDADARPAVPAQHVHAARGRLPFPFSSWRGSVCSWCGSGGRRAPAVPGQRPGKEQVATHRQPLSELVREVEV